MNLETSKNQYGHSPGIWDEMYDGENIRQQYDKIISVLNSLDVPSLQQKEKIADFSKVRYLDLQSMSTAATQKFLTEIQTDLLSFSYQLAQCYFSYS